MMKNLRTMLLATLTMVCGSVFAQDEATSTTVLWEAASGDALTTIYVDNNIKLTWEEGGGDQSPKYSGNTVLFYNGNRLKVAGVSADVTLTKVVFTFSSGSASVVTCDASGKNESTTGITNNYSGMTSTWAGEANSLIFRAAIRTNNRYISSIEVTYTGGSTEVVETAPSLNITNTTLGDTYDMDANGVFEVYAKNEGNAAAQNAKLDVLVDNVVNTSWEIGTLAIDEQKWQNMKFNLEGIEAGEHTVTLTLTADNADAFTTSKTVTFTKQAPAATFELTANNVEVQLPVETITIPVTVKNTSEVNAENVAINLWSNGVIATDTIAELAAGAEAIVNFTIDALAAGTYSMQALTGDNKYGCQITVTVQAAPVVDVIDLAITGIYGTLELANETNRVQIMVQNKGNVDITEAAVTLMAGETELGATTVSVNAGQSAACYITVASEGLEAGELNVTATVEVADDENLTDNTMEAKLTVNAVPAPEATFELTANNVEVQLPAETITIPVTVKNNSEVDATEVIIYLWNNGVIATETIAELAAGAETIVNFTIDALAAGTYSMQALTSDNKYGCYITVSVLAAPEEPVIDMAIEAIQGISEIDVTQENKVQVWYKNNGNVDLENVTINFSVNDHAQNAIVSVAAGKNGSVEFTIPTDIFEPNEDVEAELIAWVNIDDDIDATNNRVSKTLPVSYGAAPEATFAVVAENVTVEYGAESFNITATVTNTSDIDAEGVTVKLLKGATTVEEKALDLILPAGQSTTVTFTITATEEAPFTAGSTAKYYVQTGAAQAEVTVTFENAPVQPVIDMAIVDFRGLTQINLSQENKVQVWYQNNSNVDLDNVAIMFSVNDHAMEQSVNVKAGANGYVEFTIPTDIFEPTEDVEAELIAWVNVDNDVDTTNDRVTKLVPVVKGEDATAIKSIKAQFGENVQIFDLNGKKVNNVQKGVVYIVNGKKVVLK